MPAPETGPGDPYDYVNFRKQIDAYVKADSPSAKKGAKEKMLEVLRSLSTKEKGMNTQRVKRFLGNKNLRQSEFFIIHSADIPPTLRPLIEEELCGGVYVRGLDVVVVLRDLTEEHGMSLVETEAVLVHELTHSSGGENGFVGPLGSQENERQNGIFFEEGFADLIEREYIAKHGDLAAVRARSSSNNVTMHSIFMRNAVTHASINPLDNAYCDGKRTGNPSRSAYAGFGLELLCKAIPALKKVFIQSRTNPPLFQEALSLIEKYFPGLPKQLMELQTTDADFAKGNSLIIQAIYGKNEVSMNSRSEPVVQNVTSLSYKFRKALGKFMS